MDSLQRTDADPAGDRVVVSLAKRRHDRPSRNVVVGELNAPAAARVRLTEKSTSVRA